MGVGAVIPKWLRDWIAQLKPSQHSSGAGAVQIGQVHGGVSNSQTSHHVMKVTHIHNHHYQAPPPSPPKPLRPSEMPAHLRPRSTKGHAELFVLLTSMRPNDQKVLEFMEREFGSHMVIDLDEAQLYRTRRYAEAVKANAGQAAQRNTRSGRPRHADSAFL